VWAGTAAAAAESGESPGGSGCGGTGGDGYGAAADAAGERGEAVFLLGGGGEVNRLLSVKKRQVFYSRNKTLAFDNRRACIKSSLSLSV
jgi:hypothetical protein